MSVLQHELQHVLEYATGELSVLRYVIWPPNWRYGYWLGPDSHWKDFGRTAGLHRRAPVADRSRADGRCGWGRAPSARDPVGACARFEVTAAGVGLSLASASGESAMRVLVPGLAIVAMTTGGSLAHAGSFCNAVTRISANASAGFTALRGPADAAAHTSSFDVYKARVSLPGARPAVSRRSRRKRGSVRRATACEFPSSAKPEAERWRGWRSRSRDASARTSLIRRRWPARKVPLSASPPTRSATTFRPRARTATPGREIITVGVQLARRAATAGGLFLVAARRRHLESCLWQGAPTAQCSGTQMKQPHLDSPCA